MTPARLCHRTFLTATLALATFLSSGVASAARDYTKLVNELAKDANRRSWGEKVGRWIVKVGQIGRGLTNNKLVKNKLLRYYGGNWAIAHRFKATLNDAGFWDIKWLPPHPTQGRGGWYAFWIPTKQVDDGKGNVRTVEDKQARKDNPIVAKIKVTKYNNPIWWAKNGLVKEYVFSGQPETERGTTGRDQAVEESDIEATFAKYRGEQYQEAQDYYRTAAGKKGGDVGD